LWCSNNLFLYLLDKFIPVRELLLLTRGNQVHTRESKYQDIETLCRDSHHFGLRCRLVDFQYWATCVIDKSGSSRTYLATGDLFTVCNIKSVEGDRLADSMLESRDTEDGSCMFLIMGWTSGEYHEWVATCREAGVRQGSKAARPSLSS
jgi:hypothetical protein